MIITKCSRAQKLKCRQELRLLLFSKGNNILEINSFVNKMNSCLMTPKYYFHKSNNCVCAKVEVSSRIAITFIFKRKQYSRNQFIREQNELMSDDPKILFS
jgi:hypothetical protein